MGAKTVGSHGSQGGDLRGHYCLLPHARNKKGGGRMTSDTMEKEKKAIQEKIKR